MSKSKQQRRQNTPGLARPSGSRRRQGGVSAAGTPEPQQPRRAKTAGTTGPASPAHRRELLNLVQAQLGEVSRELTAQIKRMLGLTAELELLRTNVANLLNNSH